MLQTKWQNWKKIINIRLFPGGVFTNVKQIKTNQKKLLLINILRTTLYLKYFWLF